MIADEDEKPQTAAERLFVETQAQGAARALTEAEDRLQAFLKGNWGSLAGSPDLTFAQDRIRREVTLRQSIYTALLQKQERARIREVRDTPVVTVLESPRLPVSPESRKAR